MRSTFFLPLLIASASACAAEDPPERYLAGVTDVTMTFEEGTCDSRPVNLGLAVSGTLYLDWPSRFSPDDAAVDLLLYLEDWAFDFNGVHILEDGTFEGWSLYAFERDGQVIAPLFHVLEGSATTEGFDARFTEYYSDGENNDAATPSCRYVWRMTDR